MSRFHTLTVTHVDKTTRDAAVLTLEPDDDAAFGFVQGQYLTFRRDFEGHELRRSYSICCAPDEGLKVAIKRIDGGGFSTWANEELTPGERVEAMPPMGNFWSPETSPRGGRFLAFAGGSGITPVLSLIRAGLKTDPDAHYTLIYANRAVSTIMFREELEDLKNTYMERFALTHILEHDAQDIEMFTGRVDGEKCAQLFRGWIDIAGTDTAYICGPEPMMLAIRDALQAAGMPKERIRFELFAAATEGRLPRRAESGIAPATGYTARITMDGATREVRMGPDISILEAALENAMDAPHACKAGVCSTCKCRVTEGEVEMLANHSLEDYEIAMGYRLACQTYPLSEKIAVDFDL